MADTYESTLVQRFVRYYDDDLVQHFGENVIHKMLKERLKDCRDDTIEYIQSSTGIAYKENDPIYKYFDYARFMRDCIIHEEWYVFRRNYTEGYIFVEPGTDIEPWFISMCVYLRSEDFDEVIDELYELWEAEEAQHKKATADLKSEILLATA